MSDVFKSKLEKITEEVGINEIQSTLEVIIEEKPSNITESFLRGINFLGKLRIHPLIGKAIDLGNIIRDVRRSEAYEKLNEKLVEILKKQVEKEDLVDIKNLLEDLRARAIDYIVKQTGKVEQGLRHIHAPSSVAREEGRNLYFGERFTQEALYKLASRLCDSIALGEALGIYSEDEGFMLDLKQIAYLDFKCSFKIELERLGVYEYEANHPYAVFLKFILWLMNKIDVEEDFEKKRLVISILDRLKTSAISLFFMPPDREKWCTIVLPRLDIFIERFIQSKESRMRIETLTNGLHNFITVAIREARRKREGEKVRNIIDLLMNNYETFCRRLIEHGALDFYAIRNMMDIIVDLSTKYNLKLSLKPLGLLVRC
jgi:hypothetical protein